MANSYALRAVIDPVDGAMADELMGVNAESAREAVCRMADVAEGIAGIRARNEAHRAGEKVAGSGAYEAAVKAARHAATNDKKSGLRMMGVNAARASLRYVISNEKVIYSAVSLRLSSVTMPEVKKWKKPIDQMLNVSISAFREMNLGGACWYLCRIWSSISLAESITSTVTFEECKKKFFDLVSKLGGRRVGDFVKWFVGPNYSRPDLLAQTRNSFRGLLPPLWDIVYDYLAAPSADLVRQEILLLI